ncbi:phosphoserine phosphatase [Colletotrichum kahawae]|uniref:phosphoserine phosphatase n=1 Tax=Colletotrichum kahawae TaxID=34407 RepID=A0AAD9YWM3_COLKA|nr:phosphoserine phosphatase [Colletotrichum kahawae]
MADASPAKSTTSPRPQLTSSMRSSSFLREHQQYRPPQHPESRFGIDTVVEDLNNTSLSSPPRHAHAPSKNFVAFNGVPSEENPPTIVDSGLNHTYSHPNCAPAAGKPRPSRLIATLFYKPNGKHASPTGVGLAASAAAPPNAPGAGAAAPASSSSDTKDSIPANFAPTQNPDSFPLEPPASEPEKLDHLYGSYISPMCVSSFLHLMSTFPLPAGHAEADYTSSHRCLDTQDSPRVVELTLDPAPCQSYLSLTDLRRHELIYRFEREWSVDVALQPDSLWRRHPRPVVFDMDSTLITQEVIDLLAAHGPPAVAAQVADITHRAMLGELEFDAAFRERVRLLKGVPASFFETLRPALDVTRGVPRLINALKRLGVKTAVLSGGFLPLTAWLAAELGIDHAHANEVVVDEATGALTGEVKGLIVGRERKRDLLVEIAGKEGIDLAQVVAVGDGANDLLMMGAAGLGVAWNAKPMVQMEADTRLNSESLLDLLYLFGFTGDEIEQLAS